MRSLIIFEGIDGSGKTTIENAYRKANGFYDYTIHRFTGSKYVYDTMYKRGDNFKQLFDTERAIQLVFPCYLIITECPADLAQSRKVEQGEQPISLDTLFYTKMLFTTYFHTTVFVKKLRIDTSKLTIDECVNRIYGLKAL